MDEKCSLTDSVSMDMSSSSTIVTQSNDNNSSSINTNVKRKVNRSNEASATTKRSKLTDMIFYDGNPHPAAVLHDLRPEISSDNYHFEPEEISPKQTRFRCSLIIDPNAAEPLTVSGVGRSKQLAKNMAAQQALMKLYSTYRPPATAILSEDADKYHQARFIPTQPPSLQNDPTLLIDSIRKHLTTKSIAIKTPLQLFNELFINNQRLNSLTLSKNRIELKPNKENLFVVCVTAMDQDFWSVSAAKSVAQNDACQQAIETLCNVSFRRAKDEFIRALQSMDRIMLISDVNTDDNNNNKNDHTVEEQQMKIEHTTCPNVSSPLIPTEEP